MRLLGANWYKFPCGSEVRQLATGCCAESAQHRQAQRIREGRDGRELRWAPRATRG